MAPSLEAFHQAIRPDERQVRSSANETTEPVYVASIVPLREESDMVCLSNYFLCQ